MTSTPQFKVYIQNIWPDPDCERIVEHNLEMYGLESRAIRNRPVRTANFYAGRFFTGAVPEAEHSRRGNRRARAG